MINTAGLLQSETLEPGMGFSTNVRTLVGGGGGINSHHQEDGNNYAAVAWLVFSNLRTQVSIVGEADPRFQAARNHNFVILCIEK